MRRTTKATVGGGVLALAFTLSLAGPAAAGDRDLNGTDGVRVTGVRVTDDPDGVRVTGVRVTGDRDL